MTNKDDSVGRTMRPVYRPVSNNVLDMPEIAFRFHIVQFARPYQAAHQRHRGLTARRSGRAPAVWPAGTARHWQTTAV